MYEKKFTVIKLFCEKLFFLKYRKFDLLNLYSRSYIVEKDFINLKKIYFRFYVIFKKIKNIIPCLVSIRKILGGHVIFKKNLKILKKRNFRKINNFYNIHRLIISKVFFSQKIESIIYLTLLDIKSGQANASNWLVEKIFKYNLCEYPRKYINFLLKFFKYLREDFRMRFILKLEKFYLELTNRPRKSIIKPFKSQCIFIDPYDSQFVRSYFTKKNKKIKIEDLNIKRNDKKILISSVNIFSRVYQLKIFISYLKRHLLFDNKKNENVWEKTGDILFFLYLSVYINYFYNNRKKTFRITKHYKNTRRLFFFSNFCSKNCDFSRRYILKLIFFFSRNIHGFFGGKKYRIFYKDSYTRKKPFKINICCKNNYYFKNLTFPQ
jgi:hypothetical protein